MNNLVTVDRNYSRWRVLYNMHYLWTRRTIYWYFQERHKDRTACQ